MTIFMLSNCANGNNKTASNAERNNDKGKMEFISIDKGKIQNDSILMNKLTTEERKALTEALSRITIVLDSTSAEVITEKSGAEVNISEDLFRCLLKSNDENNKTASKDLNYKRAGMCAYGISENLKKGTEIAANYLHKNFPDIDSVIVKTSKSTRKTEYEAYKTIKNKKTESYTTKSNYKLAEIGRASCRERV